MCVKILELEAMALLQVYINGSGNNAIQVRNPPCSDHVVRPHIYKSRN
jgi:hypothetical protein